ncbi:MAG: hypothetical protein WC679_12725 [Bacteroidales bacterium]|jgi:hypothetical protein
MKYKDLFEVLYKVAFTIEDAAKKFENVGTKPKPEPSEVDIFTAHINRYNKSFIGLMEMDNTGEWVKFEDAREYIIKVIEHNNKQDRMYRAEQLAYLTFRANSFSHRWLVGAILMVSLGYNITNLVG